MTNKENKKTSLLTSSIQNGLIFGTMYFLLYLSLSLFTEFEFEFVDRLIESFLAAIIYAALTYFVDKNKKKRND